VESFSAFVETGCCCWTAIYIIWEAFHRLVFQTPTFAEPHAIFILGLEMCVDFFRARALNRVARKYPSEALEPMHCIFPLTYGALWS